MQSQSITRSAEWKYACCALVHVSSEQIDVRNCNHVRGLGIVVGIPQIRPSIDEAVLYERGTKLIDAGEFEKARLSLQTLINFYPATSLRQQARAAIRTSSIRQGVVNPDPMLLYQEGKSRAAAGKTETALLSFQTLINLYPRMNMPRKQRRLSARSTVEKTEQFILPPSRLSLRLNVVNVHSA